MMAAGVFEKKLVDTFSLTYNGIMKALAFGFLAVCFTIAQSAFVDEPADDNLVNGGVDEEVLVEEKMIELRIEMVKFQILSKLNLKEAPPSMESPSKASREMVRLLLKEEEERLHRRRYLLDDEERLIIHAKINSMRCLQSNESYCKMFQYELSLNMNASAVDIWIYKLTEFPRWMSIALSCFSSNDEKYYDIFYYDLHEVGWNKLQLPRLWFPSSWNDSVSYFVEIIGQNVETHGDQRPFLMVSKSSFMSPRQRRDVNCDTAESCCLKPLKVSVNEIGFNWVIYPLELEVNMCIGKCRSDHSDLRTHYERAMTTVLEVNSTLQGSLGQCWTSCCKPRVLESVRVFYNDTNNIIHDQYIPELSVKSCTCS